MLTIFKSWFDNSQSATLGLAPVYSIFMSVRLVRFVSINLDYSHNCSQTRKNYRANKINVSRIGLESAVHHLWLQPLYAYRMKNRILTNTQQVSLPRNKHCSAQPVAGASWKPAAPILQTAAFGSSSGGKTATERSTHGAKHLAKRKTPAIKLEGNLKYVSRLLHVSEVLHDIVI